MSKQPDWCQFSPSKSLESFDKKSADKIWSKNDKEIKASTLMPIRVKQHWRGQQVSCCKGNQWRMFYRLINVLWSYFSIFKPCVSLSRSHIVNAVAYLLYATSSQTSFATIKKTKNHILVNFHCAHCHNIATLAATASELLQRKSVRKLSAKNTPPHEPCGSCSALHSV